MESTTTSRIRVLLVEDSRIFADALMQGLRQQYDQALEVTYAGSLRAARDLLAESDFDAVLLDLCLPDSQGIDTITGTVEAAPEIPIVVLTGMDDDALGREAVRRGAQDFLGKDQASAQLLLRSLTYAIERRRALKQRDRLIHRLQKALKEVKQLSGLLPICMHCKKIRDDQGYWNQLEQFIHDRSEAQFTHSLCPECMREKYPDLWDEASD